MDFSASLDTVLQDMTPAERIEEFARLGFKAFELWCWWDYDVDKLVATAKDNDIKIAAACTRFISLVDRSCREHYLQGLKDTVEACRQLGCRIIISQVGDELEGVSRQAQKESMIAGLKEAAEILDGTGLTLAVEPLNLLVDHAGYFLSRSGEAAEIVNAVDSRSVRMLFDIYHQQITEGNLIPNIRKHSSITAHYHLADHPGRHEPGTGEINYRNVLKAVEETGYQGYIGLEFFPESSTGHSAILKRIRDEYGY